VTSKDKNTSSIASYIFEDPEMSKKEICHRWYKNTE